MATAAEVIAGTAAWGVDCSDALAGLRGLPDGCVQCCITSPPFYGLRDYGTATWEGGSPDCDHAEVKGTTRGGRCSSLTGGQDAAPHKGQYRSVCGKCGARRVDRQIGLEDTPDAYAARLVEVFREVRRVLHPSGVLWLNMGDSYATNGYLGRRDKAGFGSAVNGGERGKAYDFQKRGRLRDGLKEKDLLGTPWALAFALRADGWYLRCAPPLVKDNCMPESVTDRLTTAHEYWFLLAKSARYFWDADAVRVPHTTKPQRRLVSPRGEKAMLARGAADVGFARYTSAEPTAYGHPAGRNLRTSDVFNQSLDDLIERERAWLAHLEHVRAQGGMLLDREGDPLALCYPTFAFPGAHFATFSPHMITPLLKAATSERGCCPACRAPWVRTVEKTRGPVAETFTPKIAAKVEAGLHSPVTGLHNPGWREHPPASTSTVSWHPSCACPPADAVPCLVLDCFAGSGTVGLVARRLGRRFVGFDLNEQYVTLARQRIESDAPLFNGAAPAPTPAPERTLFDSLAPKED
jgi:hypothetical protein